MAHCGLGVFDDTLTLDVAGSGWVKLFGRILRTVGELRRRRYDAVYDFEFFTRFSAVVSRALIWDEPTARVALLVMAIPLVSIAFDE